MMKTHGKQKYPWDWLNTEELRVDLLQVDEKTLKAGETPHPSGYNRDKKKKKKQAERGGKGEDRLVGAASCESWTPFRVAGSNPFCMGLIINACSWGRSPAGCVCWLVMSKYSEFTWKEPSCVRTCTRTVRPRDGSRVEMFVAVVKMSRRLTPGRNEKWSGQASEKSEETRRVSYTPKLLGPHFQTFCQDINRHWDSVRSRNETMLAKHSFY